MEWVAEGIGQSPSLLIAAANLESAQASAKRAGAALLPAVGLQTGGNRTYPLEGRSSASLGASLDISWELDLWGRASAARRGSTQEFLASAADYDAARLSLAAQIAQSWFLAVESQIQLSLALEFQKNYTQILEIVQERFDAGAGTRQDLASARTSLATRQQAAQAAKTAYRESLRSLEVLLG